MSSLLETYRLVKDDIDEIIMNPNMSDKRVYEDKDGDISYLSLPFRLLTSKDSTVPSVKRTMYLYVRNDTTGFFGHIGVLFGGYFWIVPSMLQYFLIKYHDAVNDDVFKVKSAPWENRANNAISKLRGRLHLETKMNLRNIETAIADAKAFKKELDAPPPAGSPFVVQDDTEE